ncbi:hypothetical protein [Burkholderia phage vB_BglM_WTB]
MNTVLEAEVKILSTLAAKIGEAITIVNESTPENRRERSREVLDRRFLCNMLASSGPKKWEIPVEVQHAESNVRTWIKDGISIGGFERATFYSWLVDSVPSDTIERAIDSDRILILELMAKAAWIERTIEKIERTGLSCASHNLVER